jgi:hypothetical protein
MFLAYFFQFSGKIFFFDFFKEKMCDVRAGADEKLRTLKVWQLLSKS